MPPVTSRLFCALDTHDSGHAESLADSLQGEVAGFKLGLEFFLACGVVGYQRIAAKGLPIFLDLKLHDIPATVAGALAALLPLKPAFITLHASGGAAMLEAAAKTVAQAGANRPKLLAVTVLTSLGSADLAAVGQHVGQGDGLETPFPQVQRLALLAQACGMDGVVCSPHEVAGLRQHVAKHFILMVPGIRASTADAGDQKRVMGAGEALAAGADYLVVGRPITQAANPRAAAAALNALCR